MKHLTIAIVLIAAMSPAHAASSTQRDAPTTRSTPHGKDSRQREDIWSPDKILRAGRSINGQCCAHK